MIAGVAKWIAVAVLLSVGSTVTFGQARVTASVDETTVGLNDVVRYTVEISGIPFSQITNPAPPSADGLTLIQRAASTQQRMSILNGEVQQSIGFTWQYRPEKEGKAQIHAATVRLGDRRYTTDPIEVTIVKNRPSSAPTAPGGQVETPGLAGDDVFIRAEEGKRTVYQNEQILLNYVLYFKQGVLLRNSRLADSWDTEGFWREDLDVEQRSTMRTQIVNGMRYNAVTLKRVALFPTRSGELTVEPLRIESEVALPRGSTALRSLFFDRAARFQAATVKSSPVTITAKPLPSPPVGFKGTVGELEMRTSVNRHDVEAGEPIQLTVVISGVGNIATLPEPVLDLPPLIEQFGPETKDAIDRSGSVVRGVKTFIYTLVPRSAGRHTIPGFKIPYFDPSTETYRTLESPAYAVNVTGAVVPAVSNVPTSRFPIDDIAPPHDVVERWISVDRNPFYQHTWPYLALVVPMLLLVVLFLYRRQIERIATDERYARSRRAHPAARKHLKEAERLLAAGRGRDLYAEISQAVHGYIADRLGFASQGLTHPQLRVALKSKSIPDNLVEGAVEILEECERSRFSPEPPNEAMMQDVVERAAGLIAGIHEEARRSGLE